jgi:hypothetical protein
MWRLKVAERTELLRTSRSACGIFGKGTEKYVLLVGTVDVKLVV